MSAAENRDRLLDLTPDEAEKQRQKEVMLNAARSMNEANGSHANFEELFPEAIPVSELEGAVTLGNLGAAKTAIRNGADVNQLATGIIKITGVEGWTVLHVAADGGHLELVQLLVELGANKNATLETGDTPTDLASKNGHVLVAQFLNQDK